MESNELRIGNWVLWNGPVSQERALISGISREEVFFSCGESALIEEIEGEAITEELLIRFGFKINQNIYYLPIPSIKAEIHYEIHNYGNVVTLQSDFGSFIPNDIEYVHQLQNLYFTLTGEELQLKPREE